MDQVPAGQGTAIATTGCNGSGITTLPSVTAVASIATPGAVITAAAGGAGIPGLATPSSSSSTAGVAPSSVTMPAPKIQAPLRSRRMPAVDPSNLVPTRRTSNRSIKRKKFDDELVESSLIKTERGGGRVKSTASSSSSSSSLTLSSSALQSGGHVTQVHNQAHNTVVGGSPSLPQQQAAIAPVHIVNSSGVLTASSLVGGMTLTSASPLVAPSSISSSANASTQAQTVVSARLTHEDGKNVKQAETTTASQAKPPPEKRSKPNPKPSSGKSSSGKSSSGKSSSGKSSQGTKGTSSKSASGKGGGGGGGGGGTSKSGGGGGGAGKSVAPRSGHGKSVVSRSGNAKSKSKSKRSRKQKPGLPSLKDLGRWKPHDDLALITAVQQTNDLSAVHTGVKFSCRFTLKEIEERWYALLYDQSISKIAMEAARQLHSETVATIQGKALYSNAEEQLLGSFTVNSQPTLDNFQTLLNQHPDVFHPARSAKTLQTHWLLMKQHHLLPDQNVQPLPKGDHILNLSDIEDFLNDDDISEGKDETVEQELMLADRRNKREIRHLEQEMPKWHVLVDSVTGISMPDFDNQTLGVLRGRLVRYLMRSREISLGRATKDNHVDVDLSLEGPAWKVSRRQGIIKLRNSGDFFLANEGKRPILVDGKPVLTGNKQKLNNNSVVEISCLRFTFLINQDIINSIRADNSKPVAAASASTTAVS